MELVVLVGLQGPGKTTFFRVRFAATHEHGASEAHLFAGDAFVRPTSGRLTSGFGGRW